ncbi:hypothetical protein ACHAWF_018153 [Thalassiosira exigua]
MSAHLGYHLVVWYLSALYIPRILGLVISPPSSANEYRKIASLLASTFDAPAAGAQSNSIGNIEQSSIQSKVEELQWTLVEKSLTEEFIFKQYMSTARRMQGKKYCLLVAKDYVQDSDGDLRVRDDIVGIAEMGMSFCPSPLQQEPIRGNVVDIDGTGAKNDCNESKPKPTLGVLCVGPNQQKKGIGRALVGKCEEIASEVWNETCIFVDVEPRNLNAMSFFHKCGYRCCVDDTGSVLVRNTKISKRRSSESRPHNLLWKRLSREAVVNDAFST